MIFWKQMFDKDIIFIKDMVDEEGSLMSYKQLIRIYGTVCTLQQYNQLIGSLPQTWKRKIRNGTGCQLVCRPHMKMATWLKKTKINKDIYKFYSRTKNLVAIPHKILDSWETMLDTPIPRNQVFITLNKTTLYSIIRYICIGNKIFPIQTNL